MSDKLWEVALLLSLITNAILLGFLFGKTDDIDLVSMIFTVAGAGLLCDRIWSDK